MATLEYTMKLNDNFSPVIKKLRDQVNDVVKKMEELDKKSERAINPKEIDAATNAVKRTEGALTIVINETQHITQNIQHINQGLNQTNKNATTFGSILQGIWMGVGSQIAGKFSQIFSVETVKSIAATSDAMVTSSAKLKMLLKDGEDFNKLQAQIRASAKASRTSYMEMAESVANLGNLTKGAFADNSEVIKFSELVGKTFTLSGADAATKAGATRQLTQALASGVLRGDELNSILEGAPIIAQKLADYLKTDIGHIRKMGAEGKLTGDTIKNAMFKAAQDIDDQFAAMPKTWDWLWTSFKDQALQMSQPVLDRINEIANSERFDQLLNSAGKTFADLAEKALDYLDKIVNVGKAIQDHWNIVKPVLQGLGVLLGVMVYSSWQTAQNLKAAVLEMGAFAKEAQAAAAATAEIGLASGATGTGAAAGAAGGVLKNAGKIGGGVAAGGLVGRLGLGMSLGKSTLLWNPWTLGIVGTGIVLNKYHNSLVDTYKYDSHGNQVMSDKDARNLTWEQYDMWWSKVTTGVENNYRDNLHADKITAAQKRYKEANPTLPDMGSEDWWNKLLAKYANLDAGTSPDIKTPNIPSVGGGSGGGKASGGGARPSKQQKALDKIERNTRVTAEKLTMSESDIQLMQRLATRQIIARGTSTKIEIVNNNNIASNMDVNRVAGALADKVREAASMGGAL